MTKELIIINEQSGIPLIGTIMFGIIDRGTNLLQIRPTTECPLNCEFCSTDSGPKSRTRQTDYRIDTNYLIKWLEEVVKEKECEIEANIDSVGEPMMQPDFTNLVKKIKQIKAITKITMQTNGVLLTKQKITELEKAGINRINLSIETLNPEKAKKLSGNQNYDVNKIIETAKEITKTKIELLLAPVWIPKENDSDIEDIIKFAKEIGAKLGIQKYETYKYSRKVKGAKTVNYWKFYKKLEEWEKKYDIKLKLSKEDFQIKKCKRIPEVLEVGDKIMAEIKCKGWMQGQMIGTAKNRAITINNCNKEIGKSSLIKIVENKNNLYIAEMIK